MTAADWKMWGLAAEHPLINFLQILQSFVCVNVPL